MKGLGYKYLYGRGQGKLQKLTGHPQYEEIWDLNGRFHRSDGPAVLIKNGDKEYYLNGMYFAKSDFNSWIERINIYKYRVDFPYV